MTNREWQQIYRKRCTTVEHAIGSIESYQKVFLAPMSNEPQTLVEELIRQRNRLTDVTLYNVILGSPCKYVNPACYPHFNIRTFLSSPLLKEAYENQACDYIPVNFSEMPKWIGQEKIDVALIQLSPPDEAGFCNLGISVDVVQTLIKEAAFVIAEVNNQLPRTFGDTVVHVEEIDYFVQADCSLITLENELPTAEDLKIGEYVAMLIGDYATIQVGIGKVANGIIHSLKSKKGLGVHSGSFSNAMMELMQLGVITNERKEIQRGITVCTTLTGTKELYEFCHLNENVELYPTNFTHNPTVISNIRNFHAINSALEVSLFGQINAEQIGKHIVAGVGGQMDFIHGAKLSPGGKSIIALPSTAKNGKASRIKVDVQHVTSIKSEVDYIVTEYGIAKLFGKSLKDRAKSLIAIAHPDFRSDLTQELKHLL